MRTPALILWLSFLLASLDGTPILHGQEAGLAELTRSFENEVRAKVETPFTEGLATLCKRYGDACAASLKSLASQGRLDDALAVKKEIDAILERKAMPVVDPIGTTPELVRLHGIWRQEAAKLEKERSTRLGMIVEAYDARLQRLEEGLVRQSKIQESIPVKEQRAQQRRLTETIKERPASFAVYASVFDTVKKLAIAMKVDGDDSVKVRDGSLWIEHGGWDAPTAISVNGTPWTPQWTGKNSDRFDHFNPSLASLRNATVNLQQQKGRSPVKIVEQPSAANQWTLVLKFDDKAGGPDEYEVTVMW